MRLYVGRNSLPSWALQIHLQCVICDLVAVCAGLDELQLLPQPVPLLYGDSKFFLATPEIHFDLRQLATSVGIRLAIELIRVAH